MYSAILLTVLVPQSLAEPRTGAGLHATPRAISRLIDITGDGLPDKLYLGADGSLDVAVNAGARVFRPVVQDLPNVLLADLLLADLLVADLDGDGFLDLYIVSPRDNIALRGDNTGRFSDATEVLGLADSGEGLSAEWIDIDADGMEDLLLHNTIGDVIFWSTSHGFQRDVDRPDVSLTASTFDMGLAAPEIAPLSPDQPILNTGSRSDERAQPRDALGALAPDSIVVRPVSRGPALGVRTQAGGPGTSTSAVAAPFPSPIGQAKAWARFDGLTGALDASYNVASVTRSSTGVYDVTLINSMSSANYAIIATSSNTSGVACNVNVLNSGGSVPPTSAGFGLLCRINNGTNNVDPDDVYFVCFGN